MSGQILFNVMDCDGFKKPAMKLLLIALADRADEAGISWPSRDDLVLRTGLSLSTITRTARALEAAQWIQRKQRKDASTVYRINTLKVTACADQCRAARRLRRAGGEWEAFPEELAQRSENIGEGQIDPTMGHNEPTTGHTDRLTTQEPLKNKTATPKSFRRFDKKKVETTAQETQEAPIVADQAFPEAEAVAIVSEMSEFQKHLLRAGQSVVILNGSGKAVHAVKANTAAAASLTAALKQPEEH